MSVIRDALARLPSRDTRSRRSCSRSTPRPGTVLDRSIPCDRIQDIRQEQTSQTCTRQQLQDSPRRVVKAVRRHLPSRTDAVVTCSSTVFRCPAHAACWEVRVEDVGLFLKCLPRSSDRRPAQCLLGTVLSNEMVFAVLLWFGDQSCVVGHGLGSLVILGVVEFTARYLERCSIERGTITLRGVLYHFGSLTRYGVLFFSDTLCRWVCLFRRIDNVGTGFSPSTSR